MIPNTENTLIPCNKQGCDNFEEEFHHIVPKCIGGTDKHGRTYLCKKHHDIISKKNLAWLWYNRHKTTEEIHEIFQTKTSEWLLSHKN